MNADGASLDMEDQPFILEQIPPYTERQAKAAEAWGKKSLASTGTSTMNPGQPLMNSISTITTEVRARANARRNNFSNLSYFMFRLERIPVMQTQAVEVAKSLSLSRSRSHRSPRNRKYAGVAHLSVHRRIQPRSDVSLEI